jgi:DNA-binding transcriptional LysR family regulator
VFTFHQLRCFVAVAEELHFHRAAARLNMTQPPLSRQIQLLEHGLGATLLRRGQGAVRLTPAGEAFLRDARRLLRLAERAAQQAHHIATGRSGRLTLGFTAASSYGVLPRLVGLLRQHLPGLELELREMVSMDQLEALASGRVDLAVLRPVARRPGLRSARLQREPLLLALPLSHPLLAREGWGFAEMAEYPLITYPPVEGRYLHDLVMGLFQLSGAVPARVQHISQTHSILALVGAGLGLALVPEAAALLRPDGVALRPLPQPGPSAAAELMLCWREENENPALPVALGVLRREWGGVLGGPPGGE